MGNETTFGTLKAFSTELATLVAQVGASVVRVDDGSRLTATGILWTQEDLILTTSHGVERDEELTVELADGTRLAATLAGRDPDTDLALLRVAATGLTPLPTAPQEEVEVGQLVLAVARPGTSGLQATLGMINARRESQSGGQAEYVLHTDATLYPGFSGGALVDTQGRLVGLTNLMFGRGRGVALGVPTLKNVAATLAEQGQIKRGYLGVRMQPVAVPDSAKKDLANGQEHALLIIGVENGSPAEQGGLLLGDTLLAIGDEVIQDVEDLRRALRRSEAGQTVTLRLLRGGEVRDLSVLLGTDR